MYIIYELHIVVFLRSCPSPLFYDADNCQLPSDGIFHL